MRKSFPYNELYLTSMKKHWSPYSEFKISTTTQFTHANVHALTCLVGPARTACTVWGTTKHGNVCIFVCVVVAKLL